MDDILELCDNLKVSTHNQEEQVRIIHQIKSIISKKTTLLDINTQQTTLLNVLRKFNDIVEFSSDYMCQEMIKTISAISPPVIRSLKNANADTKRVIIPFITNLMDIYRDNTLFLEEFLFLIDTHKELPCFDCKEALQCIRTLEKWNPHIVSNHMTKLNNIFKYYQERRDSHNRFRWDVLADKLGFSVLNQFGVVGTDVTSPSSSLDSSTISTSRMAIKKKEKSVISSSSSQIISRGFHYPQTKRHQSQSHQSHLSTYSTYSMQSTQSIQSSQSHQSHHSTTSQQSHHSNHNSDSNLSTPSIPSTHSHHNHNQVNLKKHLIPTHSSCSPWFLLILMFLTSIGITIILNLNQIEKHKEVPIPVIPKNKPNFDSIPPLSDDIQVKKSETIQVEPELDIVKSSQSNPTITPQPSTELPSAVIHEEEDAFVIEEVTTPSLDVEVNVNPFILKESQQTIVNQSKLNDNFNFIDMSIESDDNSKVSIALWMRKKQSILESEESTLSTPVKERKVPFVDFTTDVNKTIRVCPDSIADGQHDSKKVLFSEVKRPANY